MRKRMRWSSGVSASRSAMPCWIEHGALHGVDHAAELAQRAVAHELDDAAMVLRDQRLDEALAEVLETLERSRLVALDQARVADHIGRENGGEAAVDAGGGHGVTSNYSSAASFTRPQAAQVGAWTRSRHRIARRQRLPWRSRIITGNSCCGSRSDLSDVSARRGILRCGASRSGQRNAGSSKLLSLRECSSSGPTSSRRMRTASMPISRCCLIRSR